MFRFWGMSANRWDYLDLDIWGCLGMEVAGAEMVVDALAGPGVDGGIMLLAFGKFRGFPVCESLVF